MCGIIGFFNHKQNEKKVREGLKVIKHRGLDAVGTFSDEKYSLGHCLHAIVGEIPQPLLGKGILVINCEIYNWAELKKEFCLKGNNDAEIVLELFDSIGVGKTLELLDGDYAFGYLRDNILYLGRDIMGVKPLWYSNKEYFSFNSEKFEGSQELNPRKIIIYNIDNKRIEQRDRDFYTIEKNKDNFEETKNKVIELLTKSIKKRIPKKDVGVLFSGGIDSTIIAYILKKENIDFTCYVAAFEKENQTEAEDLIWAKDASEKYGFKLKIIKIKENQLENYAKKIIKTIQDNNSVKIGVGIPFYAACEEAKKDGKKVILSGLGSEEIFAGYQRHKNSSDYNRECLSGLLKMYERDLYRDDVICMKNQLELRVPFLDHELIKYALTIKPDWKIKNEITKYILRESALQIGIDKKIAYRPKKAAQYGSKINKALMKLAKSKHLKLSEYLGTLSNIKNLKLGVLFSSGKDSVFAMYTMFKRNYEISCLITLKSKNEYSYMFHTPTINIAKYQAKALKIPIIIKETLGEKEKELEDLKDAIIEAKLKYDIEGIVTGALFSDYQRKRIEEIAESLGIKMFSPLWHQNQEQLMKELLKNNFKFIFSAIQAYGLDKTWLNKIVDQKMIDKLIGLNNKTGMNIAGEGGETESLVLDMPMFEKQIIIEESKIKEESKENARLIIKKVKLRDK